MTPPMIDREGYRAGGVLVPWAIVRGVGLEGVEEHGQTVVLLGFVLTQPVKLPFVVRGKERKLRARTTGGWDLVLGTATAGRPPAQLLAEVQAALTQARS